MELINILEPLLTERILLNEINYKIKLSDP